LFGWRIHAVQKFFQGEMKLAHCPIITT